MHSTMRHEFRSLFYLAMPMVFGGIVNAVVPFINTAFMGRVGDIALAAGGLVNVIFTFVMVLFWGVFSSVSSLVARYEGAQNLGESARLVKTGVVLALIFSLPIMGLFYGAGSLLLWAGQAPDVVALAGAYFHTLSFAVIPDFVLTVLYDLCFGLSKPKMAMALTVLFVPIDLGLNALFVFGSGPIAPHGIAGLGIGTSIAFWLILAMMILLFYWTPLFRKHFKGRCWFDFKKAKELLSVGMPVGVMWVFEVGFFMVIALLMGHISSVALAAHQMAFQTYMLFFNIIYSFSQALGVRVGDAAGAKRPKQITHAYWWAILFSIALAVLVFVLVHDEGRVLLHFFMGNDYVPESPVTLLALRLFALVPLFFLTDALGFMSFASLRALKDTRYTLMVAVLNYWCVMIPIMIVGVFEFHWNNPLILWALLIAGSIVSAIAQGVRLWMKIETTF